MSNRFSKKNKKCDSSKIKTLLLTGLLTLCVGAQAEEGIFDGSNSDGSNQKTAIGAAGAVAVAGVGLAFLGGDGNPSPPP